MNLAMALTSLHVLAPHDVMHETRRLFISALPARLSPALALSLALLRVLVMAVEHLEHVVVMGVRHPLKCTLMHSSRAFLGICVILPKHPARALAPLRTLCAQLVSAVG